MFVWNLVLSEYSQDKHIQRDDEYYAGDNDNDHEQDPPLQDDAVLLDDHHQDPAMELVCDNNFKSVMDSPPYIPSDPRVNVSNPLMAQPMMMMDGGNGYNCMNDLIADGRHHVDQAMGTTNIINPMPIHPNGDYAKSDHIHNQNHDLFQTNSSHHNNNSMQLLGDQNQIGHNMIIHPGFNMYNMQHSKFYSTLSRSHHDLYNCTDVFHSYENHSHHQDVNYLIPILQVKNNMSNISPADHHIHYPNREPAHHHVK